MNRAGWIYLVLGLVIGIAGGLFYAWRVNPVSYVDAAPSSLREDFKFDYISVIAASYATTNELDQALIRLSVFGIDDLEIFLEKLAQNRLAEGRPESEARALAKLAAAIGDQPQIAQLPKTPTVTTEMGEPSESPQPSATSPPRPTRVITPTSSAPYQLVDQQLVCNPLLGQPLLQVNILNNLGDGVPGLPLLVIWDTGQDTFYSGLKPELGLGYADFRMTEGVTYTLQVRDADRLVTSLTSETCTDETGDPYAGSWLLTFQQP